MLKLIQIDFSAEKMYSLQQPLYISDSDVDTKVVPTTAINRSNVNKFLKEHITEYRNIWSEKGEGVRALKTGAMGDKWSAIDKLAKWFKKTNFEYTWEEVLHAAKIYVDNEKLSGYKYLQAADYFVKKNDRSRLSSLIDDSKSKKVTPDIGVFKKML